jgi:glucokinase
MKQYTLSLDIGGTNIKAGVITEDFDIIEKDIRPSQATTGKKEFLDTVTMTIESFISRSPSISRIAISVAGSVDPKKGILHASPNFSKDIANIHLVTQLVKRFNLPVVIDNDITPFILAEHLLGAAKGYSHVVGIVIGTGIGGGIIINNQLYRGAHNLAGEIGHMTIAQNKKSLCGCGQTGHWEALASVTALTPLLHRRVKKDIGFEQLSELILKEDKRAIDFEEDIAEKISLGLESVIAVLDPECVVIGGGISTLPNMLSLIRQKLEPILPYQRNKDTRIVGAALGYDAQLIGGALLFN